MALRSSLLLGFALLSTSAPAFAAPRNRPRVDVQAMREAMASSLSNEQFSSSSSYAHYLAARLAHHSGNHARALEELQLALASDDGNPFLLTALAEEHARGGDLDRAERELRRVVERDPGYAPAQLLMGRVLFESRKFARARVHLQRAVKLQPKDLEGYLVLAQLSLELGRPEEAVQAVEALGNASPGEPTAFKRLGLALAEKGDFPRAQRLLTRAAERDDGDFETWVTLAQVHEASGQASLAEEAYAKALEADPESRDTLFSAGKLALKQGSATRARAYFDQLLAIADEPEIAVKVAFSYLGARELPAAAAVLDGARKDNRQEPRLSFYAGLVHEKLRRFARAAEAYSEVPKDSELYAEARLRRGSCLSSAGQHRAALDILKAEVAAQPETLALYPAYARALERSGAPREGELFLARIARDRPSTELTEALSELYERQGKPSMALDVLSAAVAQKPKDLALLFALGALYDRQGQHARSLEKMRKVLDLDPQNAMAMNFIGYALAEKGTDYDEAERLLVRALELKPDNGAILDSLGWVYFRRGDYARAVETLVKAVSLAPEEPTINEHLGDAYSRASRRSEAAEAYRRALEALRASPDLADSKGQRAALERKLKLLSSQSADR